MSNIFLGQNTKIQTEDLFITDNIISIGETPVSGNDSGIIMPRNIEDLTDYQYTGTVIAATLTSVQINETIESGWVIQIGAVRRAVISVAGTIVYTDTWPTVPAGTYYLYRDTNVAIIFKNATETVHIGFTNNNSTAKNINITKNLSLLPPGTNGYILSANPTAPYGVDWVPNSGSGTTIINLVDNVNINTDIYTTVATFIWHTDYNSLPAGKMIFYISGAADIRFINEQTSQIYMSGSYTTGFQSVAITNPTANSIINLQTRGSGLLRGAALKF